MDRSLERLFLLISLAAALTVAVLYVLGTVAISAQLHHAGVDPLDGVGLFSVGQLLVRGVAVAATPSAILGIAMVTVIFWYFFHPERFGDVDDSPPSSSIRRWRWLVFGLNIAIGIVAIVVLPPAKRLAYLPMILFLGGIGWMLWKRMRLAARPKLIGAALVAAFSASLLINAWLGPRPLPVVWLQLKAQGKASRAQSSREKKWVRGELIGIDGGIWYLRSKGVTVGIPTDLTSRVEILSSR